MTPAYLQGCQGRVAGLATTVTLNCPKVVVSCISHFAMSLSLVTIGLSLVTIGLGVSEAAQACGQQKYDAWA